MPDQPNSPLSINFGLAPMEGVTDFPARLWFQLTGAPAMVGTPFLRVTDTFPARDAVPEDIWPELTWAKGLVRYGIMPQLMASNPARLGIVGRQVLKRHPAVEMNCGCPAPRVVGGGAGSSVLKDPELLLRALQDIGNEMPLQHLSVKIRTGFSDDRHYPELIDALSQFKLLRLVVHGRTRFQHYTGWADWRKIEAAAQRCSFPVIGSGDITSAEAAADRSAEAPSVRGAMIGRGALRDPWLFETLRSGQVLALTRDELVSALGCYTLLMDAYRHRLPQLRAVVEAGFFLRWRLVRGKDEWHSCANELVTGLYGVGGEMSGIDFPKNTLGRLKMMWNSMRSSLPELAMEPTILRERSVEGLLRQIAAVLPDQFVLQYQHKHDWIYAGQRRKD